MTDRPANPERLGHRRSSPPSLASDGGGPGSRLLRAGSGDSLDGSTSASKKGGIGLVRACARWDGLGVCVG
jgi:hypothetical protein